MSPGWRDVCVCVMFVLLPPQMRLSTLDKNVIKGLMTSYTCSSDIIDVHVLPCILHVFSAVVLTLLCLPSLSNAVVLSVKLVKRACGQVISRFSLRMSEQIGKSAFIAAALSYLSPETLTFCACCLLFSAVFFAAHWFKILQQ